MQKLDDRILDVRVIKAPLTFVEVPGYETLWNVPERQLQGVYLWCIELNGRFLVNYVGKTSDRRGFEGRLFVSAYYAVLLA